MNLNEELRTVYLLESGICDHAQRTAGRGIGSWLKQAKECHVTELSSFVNGILSGLCRCIRSLLFDLE